jgi:hypothetical protein
LEIDLFRNSKAIMLFLISVKYIKEKKLFCYLSLNLLGCLFHISSLIYLPLYFVLNRFYQKKLFLVLFIIGNIIFLFSIKWVRLIFPLVANIFLGSSIERLSRLILFYISFSDISDSYGISVGYIERTLSFILIMSCYNKLINQSKSNIIFINAFFSLLFIYLYCSELVIILQRGTLLFAFSYWIIYPQIYQIISKQKKIIFLFCLLLYSCLKMISLGYDNITVKYDNILFGYETYIQRKIEMEKQISKDN